MKKEMKYGLSLISLIITVIVIIILATIIIFSDLKTPDRANLAKFVEDFSSYKMAIMQDYMNRKTKYNLEGITRSDEQIYYAIAMGDENLVDVNTNPIETGLISDLTVEIYPEKLSGKKFFEIISDINVGSINKQNRFYESAEKHYVTDTGDVFILPGYLVEENGNSRWYISENKYYTGTKVTIDDLEMYSIGDFVDYIPKEAEYTPAEEDTGAANQKIETDMDCKWRIFYINGEKVYITPGILSTNSKIIFNGSKGYFNGVNVLNDICEDLYSNADKGIKAKSLSTLDINKICNYTESFTTGYKYYLKSTEYGDDIEEMVDGVTYTYSQATMKKRFFTGIGGTTKYYDDIPYQAPATGNPVYVKNTSYSYDYPNELIKEIFNYKGVNGWIASTCECTSDGYTEYGLFVLNNDGIDCDYLMKSSGWEDALERRNNTIGCS